jgi:hypothetical protein
MQNNTTQSNTMQSDTGHTDTMHIYPMQQDIGDTTLSHSQGVIGNVSGSVYFGEGPETSKCRSHSSQGRGGRKLRAYEIQTKHSRSATKRFS